ncbi:MAG TPA: hypothetical protein VIO16_11310, partial [Dehalococcoidia bacterium]
MRGLLRASREKRRVSLSQTSTQQVETGETVITADLEDRRRQDPRVARPDHRRPLQVGKVGVIRYAISGVSGRPTGDTVEVDARLGQDGPEIDALAGVVVQNLRRPPDQVAGARAHRGVGVF